MKRIKQASKSRPFKRRGFFKREAQWMTFGNLAPFGIGVVIALIFWLTR